MAKKETKPRFGLSAGTVLLILFVIYLIILIRSDWAKLLELNAQKDRLDSDIAFGQREIGRLKREISLLDTNSYIELLAREKLGLIKKGEDAFKIVK